MKKLLLVGSLVIIALFMAGEASAKLPRDFQEFKARYQQEGRTVEGAAKLYFEAVFCYLNEATREEASKMLRYSMYMSMPIERSHNTRTFVNRMRDESYHHIFRSFAVGSTPENNYAMSPDDFKLNYVSKRPQSGDTELFLRSSGADSPRGVRMRQHDGLWYVVGNGNTYTGVRAPKSVVDAHRNLHDADYDSEGQWDEPAEETNNGTAGDMDVFGAVGDNDDFDSGGEGMEVLW